MFNAVHLREAFKYSLSLALAYTIAMYMDWSRPSWSAIAVTLCSLATVGASLNKGIMRTIGCTAGCILALLLVALFAQDRWSFVLAFIPLLFVLSIMTLISPYWYAYKKVVLVCVLVVMGAYEHWDQTFTIAVERTSETILGVVVYMLVSALLWPRYAGDQLQPHMAPVFEHLATLAGGRRTQSARQPLAKVFDRTRRLYLRSLPVAEETLSAAFYDTPSVRSRRTLWEQLRRDIRDFYDATILLHECFGSGGAPPTASAQPKLDQTRRRIRKRMARIVSLWQAFPNAATSAPSDDASALTAGVLDVDPELKAALSFRERAALLTFVEQIRIQDETSREMLALVRVLTGLDSQKRLELRGFEAEPLRLRLWDPEVLLNALRPVLTFVFVVAGWFYIEALPGGPTAVTLTLVVAMFVIRNLPADPFLFAKPFAIGLAVAAPAYFFVLPWLETPYGLFLFLLLFSFPWGYAGSRGNLFLKFFVMLTVIMTTDISNAQVYSFAQFAETAQVLMWAIVFTALSFCFLPSSQPEKVMLRTLRSFFASCARFVAARAYRPDSPQQRFPKAVFHRARVIGLPLRLRVPAAALNHTVIDGGTAEQVNGLLDAVQSVSFRLRAFEDMRDQAYQHTEELHAAIGGMGVGLRARLHELLEGWARLEGIEALERKRVRCQTELNAIGDRLHAFSRRPDLHDDQSLRVIFSTHAAAAAVMEAMQRLERAAGGMNLQQWARPRFSKP